MNKETVCRWGFLGTAVIARKNWQSILDAGNARLMGVASRDVAKARQYIAENQTQVAHPVEPKAMTYDELLAAPDIDAVYIPLPTGVRKEWVLKAARAGKHVLVEKPVGCTAADVQEMIAVCAQNGVQLMDGVMFMHGARLARLRQTLNDGESVGDIRRIAAGFSFNGGDEFMKSNIRSSQALEPFGCLGDLGWYTILFSLWALKFQMPRQVRATLLNQVKRDGEVGVPTELSAEMIFEGGVSAGFYNSFITGNQLWAHVSGTKGNVSIPDFVLPFYGNEQHYTVRNSVFEQLGGTFYMHENAQVITVEEPSNNAPGSQESKLFRDFSALVLSGKTDAFWTTSMLKTQTIMDACLASAQQDGKWIQI